MRIEFKPEGTGGFRSRLEVEIAGELGRLRIEFAYERPVDLPTGRRLRYLPDFTIVDSDGTKRVSDVQLPRWVEGKPQQFIYDLRDTLGVTRRAGDRFSGSVSVDGCGATDLDAMGVEELWKPKMLAEITGESVLVVGGVGGTSRLTVEMHPESIEFRRDHPFANSAGVDKALERERRQAFYKAQAEEWEARRAQDAIDRERLNAEEVDKRRRSLHHIKTFPRIGPTRYATPCIICGQLVPAHNGTLRKVPTNTGSTRWVVTCDWCEL